MTACSLLFARSDVVTTFPGLVRYLLNVIIVVPFSQTTTILQEIETTYKTT